MKGSVIASPVWGPIEAAFAEVGVSVFVGVTEWFLPENLRPYANAAYLTQNNAVYDMMGAGFSTYDLVFFQALANVHNPRRIVLKSRDFGWNAACLSSLFSGTEVLFQRGIGDTQLDEQVATLTNFIAGHLDLNCRADPEAVTELLSRDGKDGSDIVVFSGFEDPQALNDEVAAIVGAGTPLPTVIVWNAFKDGLWPACETLMADWPGESRALLKNTGVAAVLCGSDLGPAAYLCLQAFHGICPGWPTPPFIGAPDSASEAQMPVFERLTSLYREEGCDVLVGIENKNHPADKESLMATLIVDGPEESRILEIGQGISVAELHFFECLSQAFRPKNIFVVGNGFGWSLLGLSLIFPDAKIVAVDDLSGGVDSVFGYEMSCRIAARHGLDATVIEGRSPDDVERIVAEHFDGPVDLAFIDGLHTIEQQELDFNVIQPLLASPHVVILHDVMLTEMVDGYREIRDRIDDVSHLMARTPSGMGCIHSPALDTTVGEVARRFTQEF